MPEVQTIQELRDERARVLTTIDDIIATRAANGDAWTDEERTRHDEAVAQFNELGDEIVRAETAEGDVARVQAHAVRSQAPVPAFNVNLNRSEFRDGRSLDDLLWSTPEAVRASSGNAMNPVEQVVVRSDINDPGHLAPRLSAYSPEHRETVRAFQAFVEKASIAGLLYGGVKGNKAAQGFEIARSIPALRDEWQHICRALDVDTSAEGTEWVPTGIGSSFHDKVRASGKIAPLFQRIDLPTNPWKWPIAAADATAYRVAEPTSDTESKPTASTPGTGAVTFDAEIFGVRTLWSKSLDADSAVAVQPFVTNRLVQAFVDGEEKAILDGDTDGTHMDSDAHSAGATDVRWAWDGLRKKAIAQTVVTATTISTANLAAIRKGMGKWGLNPAELAFIVGVSSMHNVLALAEVLTVDKFGPNATIHNGQIGAIMGIPVIASEHIRENLNASGVYDAITTTKTYVLCVNRNEWAMGQRMAIDVEVDESIYRETFQRVGVAFMREDFQCIGSAATDENTAIAYNVTP